MEDTAPLAMIQSTGYNRPGQLDLTQMNLSSVALYVDQWWTMAYLSIFPPLCAWAAFQTKVGNVPPWPRIFHSPSLYDTWIYSHWEIWGYDHDCLCSNLALLSTALLGGNLPEMYWQELDQNMFCRRESAPQWSFLLKQCCDVTATVTWSPYRGKSADPSANIATPVEQCV